NDPGLHQKPGDGRPAAGPDGVEDLSRPQIQSIVVKSLKTAFGGSPSNLQLCWRLLAAELALISNCSAASRRDAPASTSPMTRTRTSPGYVPRMAHPQRRSNAHRLAPNRALG